MQSEWFNADAHHFNIKNILYVCTSLCLAVWLGVLVLGSGVSGLGFGVCGVEFALNYENLFVIVAVYEAKAEHENIGMILQSFWTHKQTYELIRIVHRLTQLFTHSHLAIHLNKLWNIQTPLRRDFHFNVSFFLFFSLCALLSPSRSRHQSVTSAMRSYNNASSRPWARPGTRSTSPARTAISLSRRPPSTYRTGSPCAPTVS